MAKALTKYRNKYSERSVPQKKQLMEVESPPAPKGPTEFLSMNDDCLEEIFTYLPLKELCSTSKVCKRLQNLAANQFKRKYKSAWTFVGYKQKHKAAVNEEYEHCFKECIENIAIDTHKAVYIDPTFWPSLRSDYKQIQFRWIKFTDAVYEGVQKMVKKAETIGFVDCELDDRLFDNLLKYCNCLKNLAVCSLSTATDGWMSQTYLSLEQLQMICCHASTVEKMPDFLQRNPTVKSLVISVHNDQAQFALIQALKKIIERGTPIAELFLRFEGVEPDLKMIDNELRQLCDRENLMRLELSFISGLLFNLFGCLGGSSSLKKLTGAHFQHDFARFSTIQSLELLKNVKTLRLLPYENFWDVNIDRNRLINLRELCSFRCKSDFGKFIVPFVRDFPQLHKIVIFSNPGLHDEERQIPLLCDYRNALKDAVKLTICVEVNTFNALKKPLETLNAKNGLVWVKPIIYFPTVHYAQNPLNDFSYIEL